MHWAIAYIGLPWVFGGGTVRGGFDCWGLFKHVQETHYNIPVSDIDLENYDYHKIIMEFKSNSEFINWVEVDAPQDGDAIVLKAAKYPSHVGVWLDLDDSCGVLHTVQSSGVIFTSRSNLSRSGWKIAGAYRHRTRL